MRFIYFLRTRTTYIVLALLSIICALALVIAGRMTIVAYSKQGQEIGSPNVVNAANIEHPKSKLPNLKTINELQLFFNGRRVEGLHAYVTSKGELLLPLDDLFNFIGIKYTFHSSDGIVEAEFNECELIIKIGSDVVAVNGVEQQLPYAVVLSNDRILVPVEVLNSINGFSASGKAYTSTAYVNYNSDYKASAFNGVFYVAGINNIEGIFSINGKRSINVIESDGAPVYSFSPQRQGALYIKDNEAYLLSKTMDFVNYKLNMGPQSRWSDDLKTIYEEDSNFNKLVIFNLDTGKQRILENVRDTIASEKDFEDFSKGVLRLVSYWTYGKTTRITVQNTLNNRLCTVLFNGQKPILVANTQLSPTGRFMSYIKDGEYRLCTFDGERDVSLGDAIAVRWITDDKIMLLKKGEWVVCDTVGMPIKNQNTDLEFLGTVNDTTVLYRDNKSIYKSISGTEAKITDTEVNVESAVATPDLLSIIAVSSEDNGVYLIRGGNTVKLAEYKALLSSSQEAGALEVMGKSIKIASDGKTISIALKDKNSVIVRIIAVDGTWSKDLRLDSDSYIDNQEIYSELSYIDNSKIAFKDKSSLWLIDLNYSEPEITKISHDNSIIKGLFSR